MKKLKVAAIVVGASLAISLPVFAGSKSVTNSTSGGDWGTLSILQKLTMSYTYGPQACAGTYTVNGADVDLITAKIEELVNGGQNYAEDTQSDRATTNYISALNSNNFCFRSTHKVLDDHYGNWTRLSSSGLTSTN